jgi:hypothetical protein
MATVAHMPTIVQSCRIEKDHAALLSRQAKRRHLEVFTLSSLYLKEKGSGSGGSVGTRTTFVYAVNASAQNPRRRIPDLSVAHGCFGSSSSSTPGRRRGFTRTNDTYPPSHSQPTPPESDAKLK